MSEGKWVTLGSNEVEDVSVAVDHLRSHNMVSTLGLWGRSMGAVTALLYGHRDPSIAGMVCAWCRKCHFMQSLGPLTCCWGGGPSPSLSRWHGTCMAPPVRP